jgi:hypothetical protein
MYIYHIYYEMATRHRQKTLKIQSVYRAKIRTLQNRYSCNKYSSKTGVRIASIYIEVIPLKI